MNISLVCMLFCHALLLRRSGANGTSTSTTSGNGEERIRDGVYIGCFSQSCIKFGYHVDGQGNQTMPDFCTKSCKDIGYSLAGLYNRTKCSCTCEETCDVDESFCGLPCQGADPTIKCGSYIAVSLYNVSSSVGINCSVPTTKPDSVGVMLQPLNIVYFSFTGAAFVVVIIVVIVRTRRRGQHDFDRAFQRHLQSNRTEGPIHYSTQDVIDYPYDSLIRGLQPFPLPPTQRGDALPMTACDWGSHTNSRRRTSCDVDDDHRHDHGGRGNDNASSGSNFYFSVIAEEDEKEEEEVEEKGKAMKGQVGERCCSTRGPSCSTEGAYAYADCHVGNDDFQRGVAKSIPNEDYK